VNRSVFSFAVVFFLVAMAAGLAQEASTTPAPTLPAASQSEIECAGFIAGTPVPDDIYVLDGVDNDLHSPVRQFIPRDSVFLRSRSKAELTVGAEYSVLRPAAQIFRTSWYEGQRSSIRTLGRPYEDVGRVRVTRVTPQAAIAEVTFACGPIYTGDLAVPYQPRAIPEYTPTLTFDRFAMPNGKMVGAITATQNNGGALGKGTIAYVNLGETDGARPGQHFRIFRIVRDRVEGLLTFPDTPRESVGEMVILSTQEKASVGMVIFSSREISLGDGVELE
jgi:hypothetical protein